MIDNIESRKIKAINYVHDCLTGKIKPDSVNLGKLIIPDDIEDSFIIEDLKGLYGGFNFDLKRIYVGKFVLGIDSTISGSDGGSEEKPVTIKKLEDAINKIIEQYYMLKPGNVTFEKNDEGKYAYLCCTIEYSRDGSSKRIIVETEDDFKNSLQTELDILIEDNGRPKDKAINYSRKCMTGIVDITKQIALGVYFPQEFLGDLMCQIYLQSELNKTQTIYVWDAKNIHWVTRESNVNGKFPETVTSEEIVNATKELQRIICAVQFDLFMLKPGRVTIEKSENGEYYFLSCTIEYSSDGTAKEITATSLSELIFNMETEYYLLMHDKLTRKEKVNLYVNCCLRGIIPYDGNTDIQFASSDEFSEDDFLYLKNTELYSIMQRYDEDPDLLAYPDNSYNTKSSIRTVNEEILKLMERYYMLRPGKVKFEKDEDDGHIFISCDIEYSRNGLKKTITAINLLDLEISLETELDLLMKGKKELLEYKVFQASKVLKSYFKEPDWLDENQKSLLWRLFNLIITGTKEEQIYARSKIIEICDTDKHSLKSALYASEIRDLSVSLENIKVPYKDIDYFINVINDHIGNDKVFKNYSALNDQIHYSEGYLYKIIKKLEDPTKEMALRCGIALKLSKDDLKILVHSTGNQFPTELKDKIIIQCIEEGITDYLKIEEKLNRIDPKMSICKENEQVKESKKNKSAKEI